MATLDDYADKIGSFLQTEDQEVEDVDACEKEMDSLC